MRTVRPRLAGVAAGDADTFARGRIRGWRGLCRHDLLAARLSVVCCADIEDRPQTADDAAWWDVRAPGSVACDAGTRVDVLERLLAVAPDSSVVLVWARVGPNDLTDSDQGWLAAAHGASTPAPSVLVVTRSGWHTVSDGVGRTWRRAPSATA